jgi:hypothetical protein
MASPIETTIETYIKAWSERDPAVRAQLIEACFAADGRLVTHGRDIVGRAAFAEMITNFQARQDFRKIRLTSAIDAGPSAFRFSGVIDFPDGSTSVETFDSGVIDASGRISLLLTFAGPLAPATPLPARIVG